MATSKNKTNLLNAPTFGALLDEVVGDTTPPSLTMNEVTADQIIKASEKALGLTVSGTTAAEVGQIVTVSWGTHSLEAQVQTGGLWSVVFERGNVPADALNSSITAIVTDKANNSSALVTQSVTIDTTPPAAPTVAELGSTDLADGWMNAAESVTTSFRVSLPTTGSQAKVGDQVELLLGGTSFGNAKVVTLNSTHITNGYVDFSVVKADLGADGVKALSSRITDVAGNAGTASDIVEFTLDTTAPTLSSTAPVTRIGAAVAGTAGNSAGETITLTVTFDGNVNGLTSGTNSTVFKVDGTGVDATWGGIEGSNTRTLTYTVAAGQNGQATIDEAELKAALVAGIADAAGNAFTYTANGGNIANIDSTALPEIDTSAPIFVILKLYAENGANSELANANSTIKLEFTSDVTPERVQILGDGVFVSDMTIEPGANANEYIASYKVVVGDNWETTDVIIDATDVAGNPGRLDTRAWGGPGDDTLTSLGSQRLLGFGGDDTLIANGADILEAGDGDDEIVIGDSTVVALQSEIGFGGNDYELSRVDGGAGLDTLTLTDGASLDLTAVNAGRITSIETIDLAADAQANTLTVGLQDVLQIAGVNNWGGLDLTDVIVLGGNDDTVDLADAGGTSGWTQSTATQDIGGMNFYAWTDDTGKAVLYIQEGLTVI